MPVQQQQSSFAARLGARVAAANAEHRDKPVDTGNRRLPAGIRSGIAKLSTMYTKQQDKDDGKTPKGETFFRASAIVVSPESHNGEKVAGMVTQTVIPLCDTPAKGQRKAVAFEANWFDFQNLFKLLGIMPPAENAQTDPTGKKVEAYYFAAMKALCDTTRPPVYIEFSTRGWTPPKTPQQPNPEEMVFETWHGLATPEAVVAMLTGHDPGAGMIPAARGAAINTAALQPDPHEPPPAPTVPSRTVPATDDVSDDLSEEVANLVEVAMNDPEGATEEGQAASARLEELAWAGGWSKEQTAGAADWSEVGSMALNPAEEGGEAASPQDVSVGSMWFFAKRDKDGNRLKDGKGKEFPSQEVAVVTVDPANHTCTVKTTKDGKNVVDIRSKKPTVVKWEWLELPPY